MAAFMDVIGSHLDRETLESLGKRVGANPSIVQRVASMALPMRICGLSRNVNASPQGPPSSAATAGRCRCVHRSHTLRTDRANRTAGEHLGPHASGTVVASL